MGKPPTVSGSAGFVTTKSEDLFLKKRRVHILSTSYIDICILDVLSHGAGKRKTCPF